MDANLRAAAEALEDEYLEYLRSLRGKDDALEIIARHLAAYRKPLEDAARAVVDDYEKQVAICDTGAMVWAKRRLLDALAEALEGEKHE